MSRSIDFICAANPSSFSSAVAMRDVRVGGFGLGASEQVERGRGGGGKEGGSGDVVVVIVGPNGEEF